MRERWADELGDPEGSLLSEEDRTILDDDTPERAEAYRRTVVGKRKEGPGITLGPSTLLRRGAAYEAALIYCPGGGSISKPYLGAAGMVLSTTSCPCAGGGADGFSAGSLTSSKNFSNPAGWIITTYLAGILPTFL